MATYTPMIEQYLHIKQQYEDCILFFQLGDFYEMFFEDAHIASQVLGIALTGRDAGQADRIPMCGIPIHAVNNYLPKLVEKGYKVAVCEQIESPNEAKGVVKRDVVRIVTPGVNLEEKIQDDKKNQFVISIACNNKQAAISIIDITTGDFYVCSINPFSTIKKLFNEVLSYNPKEVFLTFDNEQLHTLFVDAGVYVSNIKATYFKEDINPVEIFNNHFSSQENQCPDNLSDIEKIAVGWLLEYINTTQKRAIYHLTNLQEIIRSNTMFLDTNARRNLEITETIRTKDKVGSFLWVLDYTVTSMGARLLRKWVENPLLNRLEIEERLNAVEELCSTACLVDELKIVCKNIYDIERLLSKLSCGSANARDLIALKKSLQITPVIKQKLNPLESNLLGKLKMQLADVALLTDYLEGSLIETPPISIKEGGIIKKGFHEQLDIYRNISNEGKDWLLNFEKQEREKTNIKSLKVGYNKIFGYFIEVTRTNASQVPTTYQRKQTLANAERYITEELKQHEESILKAEDQLIDLEYQQFIVIREFTLKFLPKIQIIGKAIATIDALLSLATLVSTGQYVRPRFNESGIITIKQGRHPVVEKMITNEDYVPNDVYLNQNTQQVQIITGPNMAGKSTYMRQVALMTIMAQVGSFVPAEEAQLCIVDRIFTRIGASDDLASGQSTFMVEMVEAKDALLEASEKSLILLDEIGRGTSTYDGMALAHAIVEYIHEEVGAKTLFSTHYHELTELENDFSRVVNYHAQCIEKEHKVIFLRQVKRGKADKSYGVYVAQIAGMPSKVTVRAKELLTYYEKQLKSSVVSEQLSFIEVQSKASSDKLKIVKELEEKNIVNMTPLEALNYLDTLQKKLLHC